MTALFGTLAAILLRGLGRTWRVRVVGTDPFASGQPVIGALLHRDFLIAAWLYRDLGLHVAVSRSRDGDLADAVLARLGYGDSARGSSSRGGATAQLALRAHVEGGSSVAVVVDGPRGPAGIPKPGIAQLARRTARAVTPVRFEASPALRFGSWDRTLLPLPFARVRCTVLEAMAPSDVPTDDAFLDRLRDGLAKPGAPQAE